MISKIQLLTITMKILPKSATSRWRKICNIVEY